MSMDNGTQPLKSQDAVMYALGELKGQMGAVLQGQSAQADVNADNKREHEEFRKTLGEHGTDITVLQNDKAAAQAARLSRPQAVALWVAAPSSVLALVGVVAYAASTFAPHTP